MAIELILLFIFFIDSQLSKTDALACYLCDSQNGSNTACEDPLNPAYTDKVNLKNPCMQGRPGSIGEFWAQYCIKIKATKSIDKSTLTIRRCTLDKLTETLNHCGLFKLNDIDYEGCISSCTKDACNSSRIPQRLNYYFCILLILFSSQFLIMENSDKDKYEHYNYEEDKYIGRTGGKSRTKKEAEQNHGDQDAKHNRIAVQKLQNNAENIKEQNQPKQ